MRYLSVLFFLTFSFSFLSAQSKKAKQEIPERLDNSLLWELNGKGIKKSYIYGTIHMISEKDFFLTDATMKAVGKSKRLVMEIDMSQGMKTGMELLMLAPMKGGKTLKDLISEEDYSLVKNYFTEETQNSEVKLIPFEMIEKWKPMLLQSFLYQDMIEGPIKAYEMEFVNIGNENKMEFGGLETVQDQVNVFEKIPYKDQAKALVDLISQIKKGDDSGKAEFSKLVDLYKAQDIEGMVEISNEQYFEEMENGEEELLTNRNKNWIPKIKEFSKKKKTFYAVGAAHLGGPNGIIRLLMQEGYTLKPIK